MFRINKLTDYAVLLLIELAAKPGETFSSGSLAEKLQIPEPTVSKLLKCLVNADVLVSKRGRNGGYQLNIAPEDLSIASLLMLLEGPIALTECSLGSGVCRIEDHCRAGKKWQQINRVVYRELDHISLADMAKPVEAIDSASMAVNLN